MDRGPGGGSRSPSEMGGRDTTRTRPGLLIRTRLRRNNYTGRAAAAGISVMLTILKTVDPISLL
jgi:hypothetical protein